MFICNLTDIIMSLGEVVGKLEQLSKFVDSMCKIDVQIPTILVTEVNFAIEPAGRRPSNLCNNVC